MIQLLVFREPRSPFAKPEYTRLGDYEQRTDEAVEQILGRPARDRD